MRRGPVSFIGALLIFPASTLAEVSSFSSYTDDEIKELASELHILCRGGMKNASESMMKFICIMRDESWDTVERRGYCYKELGEEKFPKCGTATGPFPNVPSVAAEQRSATAAEVIQKTGEAAAFLAKEGEKGIATFKSRNAQSFWKTDGYIFVIDCKHGKVLAHPIFVFAGMPLKKLLDGRNQPLEKLLCENGLKPHGGWFEASISRPNETKARRKLVYVRPVPDTTYQVGSGIYDATITVEDLNKLVTSK